MVVKGSTSVVGYASCEGADSGRKVRGNDAAKCRGSASDSEAAESGAAGNSYYGQGSRTAAVNDGYGDSGVSDVSSYKYFSLGGVG